MAKLKKKKRPALPLVHLILARTVMNDVGQLMVFEAQAAMEDNDKVVTQKSAKSLYVDVEYGRVVIAKLKSTNNLFTRAITGSPAGTKVSIPNLRNWAGIIGLNLDDRQLKAIALSIEQKGSNPSYNRPEIIPQTVNRLRPKARKLISDAYGSAIRVEVAGAIRAATTG